MPQLAIKMNQAPGKGLGAFMPVPYGCTTPAASSQGLLRVEGHPGTVAVPSPAPAALDDGELGGPYNQPSRVAPNYILPSQYIPHISRATTGLTPTPPNAPQGNIAPVPAPYIARSAPQTQMKTRIGGRTTTAWPRQFVRWLTYREVAG